MSLVCEISFDKTIPTQGYLANFQPRHTGFTEKTPKSAMLKW